MTPNVNLMFSQCKTCKWFLLPGACLAPSVRVYCVKAAVPNPSLSPRPYRDDVSVVVNPLTTQTAKQQCAGSRMCVKALRHIIIWSEYRCGSCWWSGQRADSVCGELDPEKKAQSVPAFSAQIGWKYLSSVVSPRHLSLRVTAVSV